MQIKKLNSAVIASLIFDTYFGNHQLQWMYSGIESTIKQKETAHSCALLLSAYTKVLGGIVTGNLKKRHEMKNNYVKFLEYLGSHYVTLNEKYDLYGMVRNKLVHEFSPRSSYGIYFSKHPVESKFGIEIKNGYLIFNLQEYYRDFKNAVSNYRGELSTNGLFVNFLKALGTGSDQTIPKSNNKQDMKKKPKK